MGWVGLRALQHGAGGVIITHNCTTELFMNCTSDFSMVMGLFEITEAAYGSLMLR